MSEITDQQVADRLPDMWLDRDNVEFYRGLLQRRLLINRCADCGRWQQPPFPICPSCWSDDVRPTEVSGEGTIHSFTILRAGPPLPGVDYASGHPVVVVELAEQQGVRVTATTADVAHEELRVGMPVTLTWVDRGGEPVPAFRPAASA
ncbi:hypothetical protein GCM10010472_01970 [Pseudonocardia halophobica]|uniref:OB-fold protein n=1 Tax=Pseudonocardia halophobica TaxID=29401 RepID=A0A9W6L081_9PSEU|nr:OB-fold domain-containing protein [Pseudonocardia halophobica]GLL10537.1 hypothetical protein GCM10017577_16770 [Pseudonocardia halophobica]